MIKTPLYGFFESKVIIQNTATVIKIIILHHLVKTELSSVIYHCEYFSFQSCEN
jgi:hypothetical protein